MRIIFTKHNLQREEGFFSALVLIFIVTLGLMGMGTYVLIRSEGTNITNKVQALQAEYAANGGIYYALELLEAEELEGGESLTIGGATVSVSLTAGTGNVDYHLSVTADVGAIETSMGVDVESFGLENVAVWTTGDIDDVTVLDSTGSSDPELIIEQADSLPTMDDASLVALATSQGNDNVGTITPPDGYPSGSFYNSGTTPNVTYVDGDLIVDDGHVLYGIFVVTGNVLIKSSLFGGVGRIEGVVYLPNQSSQITMSMESATSIHGGVLTGGDIDGAGWLDGIIRHNPEYMRKFSEFKTYSGGGGVTRVTRWTYE